MILHWVEWIDRTTCQWNLYENTIKYHQIPSKPLTLMDVMMYNVLVKLCVYVRWRKW